MLLDIEMNLGGPFNTALTMYHYSLFYSLTLLTLKFMFFRVLSRLCYHSLPVNEPTTDLTNPNIRTDLLDELHNVEKDEIEIPCVVGGEKIFTGNIAYQVTVSLFL